MRAVSCWKALIITVTRIVSLLSVVIRLLRFRYKEQQLKKRYPDGQSTANKSQKSDTLPILEDFRNAFEMEPITSKYVNCGLFGYMAYDSIRFFEDVRSNNEQTIPDILYKLYRYVIIVDHFTNELNLFEHCYDSKGDCRSTLDRVEQIIFSNRFATYRFALTDTETSNVRDDEFLGMVEKGKEHCYRGDVFQIVLSRRFTTGFKGDEFNVYRSSINQSLTVFVLFRLWKL